MKKYGDLPRTDVGLLSLLCGRFGPSGCEKEVAEAVGERLSVSGIEYQTDRTGNLFAGIKGGGSGYDALHPVKVMLSAHMDEVGFIINEITSEGYLKFLCVGGIDQRVLCGRHVVIRGKDGKNVPGVIASKAIHHQTAEERKKATPVSAMYFDIGANGKEDAEKYVSAGDFGTFTEGFVRFGTDGAFVRSKAIDDRFGCTVMIQTLEWVKRTGTVLPFDLICAFTVREEIGKSGAGMAANRFFPDYAVILESTAIGDLPGVSGNARAASVGEGAVISLLDRATIYDRDMVAGVLRIAKENGIPAQVKKYVSGGNDAGHIHRAGFGTKCLAVSAPARYIHSASCVAALEDLDAISRLIPVFLSEYGFEKYRAE